MIILIVGSLGMGKTTLIRERFIYKSKHPVRIYSTKPSDYSIPVCKKNYPVERDLRKYVVQAIKARNELDVIDEAATCIPSEQPKINNLKISLDQKPKGYEDLFMEWLANSREYNNLIILAYHTMKEVPTWLMLKGANYLIRFQTNDMYDIQARRFSTFPNIVKSFLQPEDQQPKGFMNYDEIKIRDNE